MPRMVSSIFCIFEKFYLAARELYIRLLFYRVDYVAEEHRSRDGQHCADNARYEHDNHAGDKRL